MARHHSIEYGIAAAHAAGFAGIGLYIGEYLRVMAEGNGVESLADMLDEHALGPAEIKGCMGGQPPGPP